MFRWMLQKSNLLRHVGAGLLQFPCIWHLVVLWPRGEIPLLHWYSTTFPKKYFLLGFDANFPWTGLRGALQVCTVGKFGSLLAFLTNCCLTLRNWKLVTTQPKARKIVIWKLTIADWLNSTPRCVSQTSSLFRSPHKVALSYITQEQVQRSEGFSCFLLNPSI